MSGCADSEPFALQVTDESMQPEFPKGCVIVIEPDGVVEDGSYVIAESDQGLVFRQLQIIEQQWQLIALDISLPAINISGLENIKGRVIQKGGRRQERKKYL